jgi:hypothetical protein
VIVAPLTFTYLMKKIIKVGGARVIGVLFRLKRSHLVFKKFLTSQIVHFHVFPCSQLCMVTLSLFETLLSLNNEQILLDLILKFIINAKHVPIAQKHKINSINLYAKTLDFFIDLAPEVMKNSNKIIAEHNSMDFQQPSLTSSQPSVSRTIGANWNHFELHSGDTLYSNYHAYLYDAHQKIKVTKNAVKMNWSEHYFYKPPKKDKNDSKQTSEHTLQLIKSFLSEFQVEPLLDDQMALSGNGSKQLDSLQSLGESSGYESMKCRMEDDEESTSTSHNDSGFSTINYSNGNKNVAVKNTEPWRTSKRQKHDQNIEMELTEDIFTQGTVSLGEVDIKFKKKRF